MLRDDVKQPADDNTWTDSTVRQDALSLLQDVFTPEFLPVGLSATACVSLGFSVNVSSPCSRINNTSMTTDGQHTVTCVCVWVKSALSRLWFWFWFSVSSLLHYVHEVKSISPPAPVSSQQNRTWRSAPDHCCSQADQQEWRQINFLIPQSNPVSLEVFVCLVAAEQLWPRRCSLTDELHSGLKQLLSLTTQTSEKWCYSFIHIPFKAETGGSVHRERREECWPEPTGDFTHHFLSVWLLWVLVTADASYCLWLDYSLRQTLAAAVSHRPLSSLYCSTVWSHS